MNWHERKTFAFNGRKARRLKWATREWQAEQHVCHCRMVWHDGIDRPFAVVFEGGCIAEFSNILRAKRICRKYRVAGYTGAYVLHTVTRIKIY